MIFISYRRDDSRQMTNRIFNRLCVQFGKDSFFMDVNAVPFGRDFREVINRSIIQSSAVLVVIGPNWLTCCDSMGRRRLEKENDFVRMEIARTLSAGRPTIPLLVDGAEMPDPDDLPSDIRNLAFQNAAVVRGGPEFKRDTKRLIRDLVAYHPNSPRSAKLIMLFCILIAVISGITATVFAFSPKGKEALDSCSLGWYGRDAIDVLLQLLSYSFVNPWEIFIGNMGALLCFGLMLRKSLSAGIFIRTYLFGAIAGGASYLLFSFAMGSTTPITGSGTAIMAVLGAATVYHPDSVIRLLFWNVKLKWCSALLVAINLMVTIRWALQGSLSWHTCGLIGFAIGISYAILEKTVRMRIGEWVYRA